MFVSPELSLPFYQYSAIRDHTYDPLAPSNVVPAYGEPLLRTLYAKAVGEYFRRSQTAFARPDYPQAHEYWGCNSAEALEAGWTKAGQTLSEWAETANFWPPARRPLAAGAANLGGLLQPAQLPTANRDLRLSGH